MKRRDLLKILGSSTLLPKVGLASEAQSRRLLVVYNQGGWDVSMLFDPQFSNSQVQTAQDGQVNTIGGLTYVDSPSRPNVTSFMSRFGSSSTIINGLGVGSISHKKCERLLFTGSRLQGSPDFGSMIAQRHTDLPLPYAILSGPRMTGDLGYNVARVDQTFVSILRQDPVVNYEKVYQFIQESSSSQGSARISEYWETLNRRQQLSNAVDLFPDIIDSAPSAQVDLSLQLLANNVSAVTMLQILPPPFHQWDTHSTNDQLQSGCFDYLFQHLLYLGNQLESTLDSNGIPLIESTTVVVLSEMGRTPVYNSSSGKDHWPYTSMLLFGSQIRGGTVVGASDSKLTSKSVDLIDGQPTSNGVLLKTSHVLAGLLTSFDIDPAQYFDTKPFTAPFV